MIFNSQEVAWNDVKVSLFTAPITKLTSVKYKKSKKKEVLYAAGSEPVGIQDGNSEYTGSLKVLKGGLDLLNAAAQAAGFKDISEVPYASIVITINYKTAFNRSMQTDVLQGVSFTDFEYSIDQGATKMEIELPFMFLQLN